jgi:hypothetical protein
MTVNNELRRMWKKAIMACFKILHWICQERMRKTMKPPVRRTDFKAENWTQDLLNARSINHLTMKISYHLCVWITVHTLYQHCHRNDILLLIVLMACTYILSVLYT